MTKQKASIKDWHIVRFYDVFTLVGQIIDHPKQVDFKEEQQMTSHLLRIDFEKGEAETRNTIYTLLGEDDESNSKTLQAS